jgi:GTP-binding protein
LGTIVRDLAGTTLADLAQPGQRVELLEGGRGGKGNAALVSRSNVAPNFAEQGEYGEEQDFIFELKLIADAALIGFPNAGKSTLISRVSAARPKIADYPFTTLEPNLGVVEIDDRRFVLADIPGLIEGAADGKGLGHDFLRHAERARVLVILLDPSDLQETDCVNQLATLRGELMAHDPALAARAEVIAVAKSDLGDRRRGGVHPASTRSLTV